MILLNKNNQIYNLFNVLTHFCECGTVQSGHLKSPARTKVNIYKIIFPKNKGTFIILMTVVIQYANAYFNLKNQDLRSNAFVDTKTGDTAHTLLMRGTIGVGTPHNIERKT